MPPTTWDIPTFADQQRDIDEIDTALPLLDTERDDLRKRQSELESLTEQRGSDESHESYEDITAELRDVTARLEAVELQRRGRLMMAKECEEANRKMLEDVSVEFLTKGEKEQLGALRLKLSRILFQYGSE